MIERAQLALVEHEPRVWTPEAPHIWIPGESLPDELLAMPTIGPGVGPGYRVPMGAKPFLPLDIGNYDLDLNGKLGVTTDAHGVILWADQSGKSNDVEQTVADDRKPSYPTGDFVCFDQGDGPHQMRADAGTDPADVNAWIGNSGFSILAICTSDVAKPTIAGTLGTAPSLRFEGAQASYIAPDDNLGPYAQATALKLRHWLHSGTNFIYRENGVQLATVAVALGALRADRLHLARAATLGTFDLWRLIAYSKVLSALEIAQIEAYLMGLYL